MQYPVGNAIIRDNLQFKINKGCCTVNKQEIISAISEKSNLTKKDADKFLSAFEDAITEALVKGQKVQLVGFLTIDVVERAEREGRNPQTGQPMKIAASKAPRFKAGKSLRDAVNGK